MSRRNLPLPLPRHVQRGPGPPWSNSNTEPHALFQALERGAVGGRDPPQAVTCAPHIMVVHEHLHNVVPDHAGEEEEPHRQHLLRAVAMLQVLQCARRGGQGGVAFFFFFVLPTSVSPPVPGAGDGSAQRVAENEAVQRPPPRGSTRPGNRARIKVALRVGDRGGIVRTSFGVFFGAAANGYLDGSSGCCGFRRTVVRDGQRRVLVGLRLSHGFVL